MIHVIATVTCKPGHRASFLEEFRAIIPQVLQEVGCLEYGPAIDAATDIHNQNLNESRVTIIEKWESVDALRAHLAAPHMLEYRPKVKDLIESTELRVLESAA